MNMTRESHTEPREFIRRLRQDALSPQTRIIGMVKPPEEDDLDRILFSQHCVDWILIPVDMIESIEHLGSAPCQDHSHPLVAITFREPTSPEGQVLAQLLTSYRHPRNRDAAGQFPSPWPCWACELLPFEEMLQCILNCRY
jgi:CheY-like chemotaxis protein